MNGPRSLWLWNMFKEPITRLHAGLNNVAYANVRGFHEFRPGCSIACHCIICWATTSFKYFIFDVLVNNIIQLIDYILEWRLNCQLKGGEFKTSLNAKNNYKASILFLKYDTWYLSGKVTAVQTYSQLLGLVKAVSEQALSSRVKGQLIGSGDEAFIAVIKLS